jgi:hypothetical protein
MTRYRFNKAMRVLDHAIDSLGDTEPCGLLIMDGKMHTMPGDDSPKQEARAILAQAMCVLVREYHAERTISDDSDSIRRGRPCA